MDDLASLMWPLPPAVFPFAVVAYRETSETRFCAVLQDFLRRALAPVDDLDLAPGVAAALRVKLAAAAGAGRLPAARGPVAAQQNLPEKLSPLMHPLSVDSFPFVLAAFFDAMPSDFFTHVSELLAGSGATTGLHLLTPDSATALRSKFLALGTAGKKGHWAGDRDCQRKPSSGGSITHGGTKDRAAHFSAILTKDASVQTSFLGKRRSRGTAAASDVSGGRRP
ncbi:unnamed protein product [Symbiodinium natans]|uniref:Uncharacterized protein n=1 Tax=Symbiodinium natans TaxID=878477 RepID=A0A812RFR8_9DINO|nr:unnamed protein product [Symbiodinium natans]